MWKYYIKIAWRNFRTNKLFSVLNLLGLSIGIAICIPLFLFVNKELSFDTMYKNKEDIYRINLITNEDGDSPRETWASVPNAVAPSMVKDIPEVRYAARMLKNGFGNPARIKADNQYFSEKNLFWCDVALFKIFDFDFIAGNADSLFKSINEVVLSESEAKKLFGRSDPIGQTITVDDNQQLVVKGVYKDLPENSSIHCSMIANFQASRLSKNIYWSNASYETYCLMDKGVNPLVVKQKLNRLLLNAVEPDNRWFSLELQPLETVHLYSKDIKSGYTANIGDIKNVHNLSLLGLLILLIACINYMNLATARSEKRIHEVGINKTLGASKSNMILRFYLETALIGLFAIAFGFILSFGSLSVFNYVTDNHLSFRDLLALPVAVCLVILWLIITMLAGSYPALLLSKISALQLMRGKFKSGGIDRLLRKSLVIVQFSCSIILIIAVLIIYQQMKFIGNQSLGYQPDGVIGVNLSGITNNVQIAAFRNELLNLPDVEDVAMSQTAPGFGTSRRDVYKNPQDKGLPLYTSNADDHIVKTLGLKLIAGSSLPNHIDKGDTTVYLLVNKNVVAYMGWKPSESIGRKLDVELGDHSIVVGVVDNFNYASLKEPIGAYLYYRCNDAPESNNMILIRLKNGQFSKAVDNVKDVFKKFIPEAAFDYQFLDTHLASLYSAERVMEKSAILFSILAIFVSSLGLFGLSAFMAEQRTKEVGIRKVLGASVFHITRLLSKDFLKLVCLAIVIAIPVAIWLMNSWLQHFEYRISISWTVIAFAGLLALFIALFTVSLQSVKTALSNPIDSLKTE